MKRLVEEKLLQWKSSENRKPLIIYGARQIGKTYSILNFGNTNYDNVVYCNFEDDEIFGKIFEESLSPEKIIKALSIVKSCTITKGKTLIIFDEIQACEKALTSLKYFNEQANDYHIIAAGSLLGLAINRGNFSFPVGKVDMINMYPLNFEEFLMATGNENLIQEIKFCFDNNKKLEDYAHEKAMEIYKTYLVVGGYPNCVEIYLKSKDFNLVRSVQTNISNAYISDMAKYATPNEMVKSINIYKSLDSQLAKENSKFQYNLIKSGARAKDYELSLNWLRTAGVVLNCYKITEGKYPISIYEDLNSFKVYYSDVGLLTTKMQLLAESVLMDINLSDKIKGMLAENYVAEELTSKNFNLHYWESGNTSEVDFVIQYNGEVLPIEVKSKTNVRAKSLNVYVSKYNPPYSIRVSAKNFGFDNNIKSIPLYALFCL